MGKKRIAIFASGSGTNAEEFFKYFQNHEKIHVEAVFSNKKDAFVLTRARQWGIEPFVFNREQFYHSHEVLEVLQSKGIDYICLAGFLWLVPNYITEAYQDKIINIHPALLPRHGGKGMYGDRVHQAVIDAGEKESGITIHYVNQEFDKGEIIFQARCEVQENDTADQLAARIHTLEYAHFPRIVEEVIQADKG